MLGGMLGGGMGLLHVQRYGEPDYSAASGPRKKFDVSVYELGSLSHGNQSHSLILLHWRKSHSMVFHFEHHRLGLVAQPHFGLSRFRMARDVGQCFLQNPIEVDGHIAVDRSAGSALLVSYFDSVLFLKSRQIDAERALETGIVEHHRMQRLRERADLV